MHDPTNIGPELNREPISAPARRMGGNAGRSSTGCATCRKRKIKCDESRPACRRCSQIRKPCPGYPFQIQLGLRLPDDDQPTTAILPATVPATPYDVANQPNGLVPQPHLVPQNITFPLTPAYSRASTEPLDPKVKVEESEALARLTPQHEAGPESPPKYDVQHQSICFFVHLFCFQAGKLYSFPVLDFIPHILQKAPADASVTLAATAVSRMTLADQYSGTDVRLQTGYDYSRALTSTMASIKDPAVATSDATVVAVWLLGLYEAVNSVLSHGRASANKAGAMTPDEEWQSHISHIRGASHLLRMRGTTQLDNPQSEKTFRVFKAAIQLRLFMLNSVRSKDFGGMELDIYADEHEFVPSETGRKASAFFLRIARLTEEIKNFLINTDRTTPAEEDTSRQTQALVTFAEGLDKKMTGWADIEAGWQMMRVRASPKGTSWSLYPNHALYYFYSFWVYLYWIRYLIARVKLYEALVELVKSDPLLQPNRISKLAAENMKIQIESYITIIQMTGSQLIGLTAYALGDVANTGGFNSAASELNPSGSVMQEMNVVAAMQLVLPLKTLLRGEYMTNQQRGALDIAINLIGDGFRRHPGKWS